MKSKIWLTDPPSPFAPRFEWVAYLADLRRAAKGRRSPDLDAAIAAAEDHLATPPNDAEALADAEALKEFFGPRHDGGLAERMDAPDEAFKPTEKARKTTRRRVL